MNYIHLKDVSKYWGTTKAVENLNIEIKKGEFVIFLGPSGCGKSTTLRLIAGLEEVSSGQIEIDGKNVTTRIQQIEMCQWYFSHTRYFRI